MTLASYIDDFIVKNKTIDPDLQTLQDHLRGVHELAQLRDLMGLLTKNKEPLSPEWSDYIYRFIYHMACWEDWSDPSPRQFMVTYCLDVFPEYDDFRFEDADELREMLTARPFDPDSLLIKIPRGQLFRLHFMMSMILGFPEASEKRKEKMVSLTCEESFNTYLEQMLDDEAFEFTDLQRQWWLRLNAELLDASSIEKRIDLNKPVIGSDVFLAERDEFTCHTDKEESSDLDYIVVRGMINCFGIYIYTKDRMHLYAAHISPAQLGLAFYSMFNDPNSSGRCGESYFRELDHFLSSVPDDSPLIVAIFDKRGYSSIALKQLDEKGVFQRKGGCSLMMPDDADLAKFEESEYHRWSSIMDVSNGRFSLVHNAISYICNMSQSDVEQAKVGHGSNPK